jgi:hypothetical protein
MSRPRRKPRTTDRVILALRDRILAEGGIDAQPTDAGRWRSARPPGMTIGPSFTLPVNAVRLRIHAGRGRPPAGFVGLIQAIAIVSGYSTSIIARVLSGRPRASTRRDPTTCLACGASSASSWPPDVAMHKPIEGFAGRTTDDALAAVGLAVAPGSTVTPPPPPSPSDAVIATLTESLDAAIAMGSLPASAVAHAEQLLSAITRKPSWVSAENRAYPDNSP